MVNKLCLAVSDNSLPSKYFQSIGLCLVSATIFHTTFNFASALPTPSDISVAHWTMPNLSSKALSKVKTTPR